ADATGLGRIAGFALHFRDPGFFTDATWLALAHREAALTFPPFTPIFTDDDGQPLDKVEGISDDGIVGYRAEDSDLDVDLMPSVTLALNQGALRVGVTIKQVVVHCVLTTWSMLDTSSEKDDPSGPFAVATNAFLSLAELIAAGAIANHGN